jgi:hypothetical protein
MSRRLPPSLQIAALNKWKQDHAAEIAAGTRFDPFHFFVNHEEEWPELSVLAFCVLGRDCTSANVERLFSRLKRLQSPGRARLSTRMMYYEALVQMNRPMAEAFWLPPEQKRQLDANRAVAAAISRLHEKSILDPTQPLVPCD